MSFIIPLCGQISMDAIAITDAFDWDPGGYGVSTVAVQTDADTDAKSHFFACMARLVDRFGVPSDPTPMPDLASHEINPWRHTLANGDTVFGAFWLIECGWKSLQLDSANDRVLYLVNHS